MNDFYAELEPPKGLFGKIIRRIHREQRLLILKKIIIFSVAFAGSFLMLGISLKMLAADVSQSGFFNLSLLAFSDFSIVIQYWKNFGLALLETLPAVSIALFFAGIVLFLETLKSFIKNVKYETRKVFSI